MRRIKTVLAVIVFGCMTSGSVKTQVGKKGESPTSSPTPATKTSTTTKKATGPTKSTNSKTSRRGSSAKRTQDKSIEQTYWESIKDSTNPEDFRTYLQKYPDGVFTDIARNRIRSLEAAAREREADKARQQTAETIRAENTYWESIKNSTNPEDFKAYLRKYPNGEFADLARNRIDSLKTSQASPAQNTRQNSQAPANDETLKACNYSLGSGIYNKWLQVKDNGFFLCPTMNESEAGRSPQGTTGRFAWFKGEGDQSYGVLTWHRTGNYAGRSFAVYGCNFRAYLQVGGSNSWLGFPISDEYDAPGGRRNDFEGGYIFWNAKVNSCQAYKK
jgi:hypothetical protein